MVQMNVPLDAIVILPTSLDNTAQEATSVRQAALNAGWHRLIVVTSKYHTRRTLFAFEREFQGTAIRNPGPWVPVRGRDAGPLVDFTSRLPLGHLRVAEAPRVPVGAGGISSKVLKF